MKTFEEIMETMLSKVPDDIDKREGSIIYTAISPCAAALAGMYVDMELERNLAFASTSSGKYLDMLADEIAIKRNPAIKAKRKALFKDGSDNPKDVDIGSRFATENVTFAVTEKVTDGEFIIECETEGESGNIKSDKLLPLDNISGLATATLTDDIVLYGSEEESDEDLYKRYKLKVQKPITSGNSNQYLGWALEVAGVGSSKVFPLWNGNGTVKVIITDTDQKPAGQELIDDVINHIESVRPIGATVTIASATAKNITITGTIQLASGYFLNNVKTAFESSLNSYFKSAALNLSYISYAKIGSILLSTDGVLDYSNLTVNSTTANIPLADDEIPVLQDCEVIKNV